jgi:UV DNA damage repair endonuclease
MKNNTDKYQTVKMSQTVKINGKIITVDKIFKMMLLSLYQLHSNNILNREKLLMYCNKFNLTLFEFSKIGYMLQQEKDGYFIGGDK